MRERTVGQRGERLMYAIKWQKATDCYRELVIVMLGYGGTIEGFTTIADDELDAFTEYMCKAPHFTFHQIDAALATWLDMKGISDADLHENGYELHMMLSASEGVFYTGNIEGLRLVDMNDKARAYRDEWQTRMDALSRRLDDMDTYRDEVAAAATMGDC